MNYFVGMLSKFMHVGLCFEGYHIPIHNDPIFPPTSLQLEVVTGTAINCSYEITSPKHISFFMAVQQRIEAYLISMMRPSKVVLVHKVSSVLLLLLSLLILVRNNFIPKREHAVWRMVLLPFFRLIFVGLILFCN